MTHSRGPSAFAVKHAPLVRFVHRVTHAEPPIVRLFRDALESVVAPHVASAALFEALDAIGGDLPTDADELLAVARGPLHESIARRLGQAQAKAVIARITEVILTADAPTGRKSRPQPKIEVPTRAFDEEQTAKVRNDTVGGNTVVVIAAGTRMSSKLRTALGPNRATIEHVSSATRLATVLSATPPGLVIVDATDYPPIEPEVLAGALAKPPPPTIRAIWGADLIYGQRVAKHLAAAGSECSPIERNDGIEPLLDLIRSRSSA
jgi:hypothetical protein